MKSLQGLQVHIASTAHKRENWVMKNKAIGLWLGITVLVGVLVFPSKSAKAFALLGPVQPWMQTTNGVLYPGDIGGPMELTNEYRWNVPVVTYGFDQSFLDFFGSNGVAAVEGAIQILNNLPPASQIVLTNYPFDSREINVSTQAQSLLDLKSQTLSLLVEQLGLAKPEQNIYVLQDWDPTYFSNNGQPANITILGMPIYFESEGVDLGAHSWNPGYVTNFVSGLNFDPESLAASVYVNNTLFAGDVRINTFPGQNLIIPFSADPLAPVYTAVAGASLSFSQYYSGLTRDDVGGLRYLLSTNNINYETLLDDVQAADTNSFVNGAWRPGVDKIIFIPQLKNSVSGGFLPTTNYFTDNFMSNGMIMHQQLVRIVKQPDFLFSAGDVNYGQTSLSIYKFTGTTNWLNNATANDHPSGAGPGVIQPQITIVFNKLGHLLSSDSFSTENHADDYSSFWGSFDGSTNTPVVYPSILTPTNRLTIWLWLQAGTYPNWRTNGFEWGITNQTGTQSVFQTSTNLSDWTTLFTVTNDGSICTYLNYSPSSQSRFYRVKFQ